MGKYTTTVEGIEAEPHHVWEYPSDPRSEVHTLMSFDMSGLIQDKTSFKEEGEITLYEQPSPCQGVVLWMDYVLTDKLVMSTGLLEVGQSLRSVCKYDVGRGGVTPSNGGAFRSLTASL